MDGNSEGSLTVDNYTRRWTGKDIRNRSRGMSVQYPATTG